MSDPVFQQPYVDPLWDMLDQAEKSVESAMGPEPLLPGPVIGADPMDQMLGAVEASIEGTIIPAPLLPEPFAPEPSFPPLIERGPVISSSPSAWPPVPASSVERHWTPLEPPQAARPYHIHEGLNRPAYHPRGGSGAGIRNSDRPEDSPERLCPMVDDYVNLDACGSCEHWIEETTTGLGWCGYRSDQEENRGSDDDSEE